MCIRKSEINPRMEVREMLYEAYMAGFAASTNRLNGDTKFNGKDLQYHDDEKVSIILEYLGIEVRFTNWLGNALDFVPTEEEGTGDEVTSAFGEGFIERRFSAVK